MDRVRHTLEAFRPRREQQDIRDFEWAWLDRVSRAEPRALRGHVGPVIHAAWSSDGRWFATGGEDGALRIWEHPTGRQLTVVAAHASRINWVECSHDGRLLVTAGEDEELNLWKCDEFRHVATLTGHATAVTCAAFSRDDQSIFSGDDLGILRRWNVPDGRGTYSYAVHADAICGIDVAGDRLATAAKDGCVKIWNATDLSLHRKIDSEYPINTVALSPAGDLIAEADYGRTIGLWDAETGKHVANLSAHSNLVRSLRFSPNGDWLLAADDDGGVRVWNVNERTHVTNLLRHEGPVRHACLSPDGSWLVSTGDDSMVRVWNLDLMLGRRRLSLASPVTDATISRDGRFLATACRDGWVRMVHLADAKTVDQKEFAESEVTGVSFAPDGRLLAAVAANGTLGIFEAPNWQLRVFRPSRAGQPRYGRVAISSDGRYLAETQTGKVLAWDLTTGQIVGSYTPKDAAASVAAHPLEGTFAVGSRAGPLQLSDPKTGKVTTLPGDHVNQVCSLAFSPDGKRLASSSIRGRGAYVMMELGQHASSKTVEEAWSNYNVVAYSPSGRTVAVERSRRVYLWNAERLSWMTTFHFGLSQGITSLAFVPGDQALVVAGWERDEHGQERGMLWIYEGTSLAPPR
jgi:WD40 repeat protein